MNSRIKQRINFYTNKRSVIQRAFLCSERRDLTHNSTGLEGNGNDYDETNNNECWRKDALAGDGIFDGDVRVKRGGGQVGRWQDSLSQPQVEEDRRRLETTLIYLITYSRFPWRVGTSTKDRSFLFTKGENRRTGSRPSILI
jgi:hypothetical protein